MTQLSNLLPKITSFYPRAFYIIKAVTFRDNNLTRWFIRPLAFRTEVTSQ